MECKERLQRGSVDDVRSYGDGSIEDRDDNSDGPPKFVFDSIKDENKKLRKENEDLKRENKEFLNKLLSLMQYGHKDGTMREIEETKSDIINLNEENEIFKLEINILRRENEELKIRLNSLEKKSNDEEHKEKKNKISIRKSMKELEFFLIFDIIGSELEMKKKKIYKISHLLKAIKKDEKLKLKLQQANINLTKNNQIVQISEQDLENLIFFKSVDNGFLHYDVYVNIII
jgi:hypothetical protein